MLMFPKRTISSHLTAGLLECDGSYAKNPSVTARKQLVTDARSLLVFLCRSSLLRRDLNRINLWKQRGPLI